MNDITFHCDRCGMCCRNVNQSEMYKDLHDGSGICKYLNIENNLCTIYSHRPDKCNIEKFYENYKEKLSYEEYILLNKQSCELLKGGE